MLAEDNRTSQETYFFNSNEPLLLDDRETIWLVQSGSFAVFAIAVEHGTPKGKRRYLFTVKAGEAMFSAQFKAAEIQHQLLAVALEETELSPIRALNRELIDRWIDHLGAAVSEIASPKLPTPFEPIGCGVLAEGEVFQPLHGTIVWAQILQGSAKLLGSLEVTFATGRIPLQRHLWINATDVVEIDYCTTNSIIEDEALLNGIYQLQLFILQAIQQLDQCDRQQELAQFQAREHLNTQAIATTLSNLATVFEIDQPENSKPAINPEQALLMAAGAVGRFLHISICPPAKSEDLQRVRDPLDAIARASRIRMRRITLRDQWWKQDCGALLAYTLEDERPVALIPVSEMQYEIIDPLRNTRKKCDRQTALTLSPTAYTFYRPLPENLKILNLLKFATQGHSKELFTLVFTGIAATLLGMIVPQATAILMDHAIPDANRSLLFQIALGLFATALGTTLFQFTQGIAVTRLETFADSTTQAAVWDRLLNLKATFFRNYSIGDLSARVSVIGQIRSKLSGTILKSLFSSVFSFLNLGLLFYYSPALAMIAVVIALLNIAVTIVAGILTFRQLRPLLAQQGKLFGMMVQIINGVAKFRVAGAEARAFAYWGQHYRQQLKLTLKTEAIEDNLTVVNHVLSALTPAILFACSIYLIQSAQSSGFSTGTFLAFNAAFGTFIGGATTLSTTVLDVLEVLPMWERAQPILQATPEIDTTTADPGRLTGRIELDRIVFRYCSGGALTLNDVSLRADPGEFIALVGPSGSGKSTLLRLLLGFDLPESGAVRYDGQELTGLDVHAVRRQLGVVLQNSRVMSASIFENIASSALITMNEAWDAARMSGLAEDIATMPMGMHTVVSEGGTNLSGGQRQRLLIARALALRPRILLFDEATSALDNRTQAIVSESLDRLNVTRVVIAHRLSTIRNADRIYVLQNGQLIQQGRFEELANQTGLFRQLIDRQQV